MLQDEQVRLCRTRQYLAHKKHIDTFTLQKILPSKFLKRQAKTKISNKV